MAILNIVIELDCIGLEMFWLDKSRISLDRTVQRIGWDFTGFEQMGLQGVDFIVVTQVEQDQTLKTLRKVKN